MTRSNAVFWVSRYSLELKVLRSSPPPDCGLLNISSSSNGYGAGKFINVILLFTFLHFK